MTAEGRIISRRRKRSLRRRLVVSLMGLAVLPLAVTLAALFFVVRNDIGTNHGRQLAQETAQLAGLLQGELQRWQQTATGLAALPEARSFLAGSGPFPREVFTSARQSYPAIRSIELIPRGRPAGIPAEPVFVAEAEKTLHYQVPVTDREGSSLGLLHIAFRIEELQKPLELAGKGEGGGAVLFTTWGFRLAGNAGVPLPPPAESDASWRTFEASGETFFAGLGTVQPPGAGFRPWFLAVVQPASQVYGHFDLVSRQIAFLLAGFGILVVTLAWRMADQFLRPIFEIRRGAGIVSRINLEHRIKVDTGDELEELAVEFNLMAENLGKAYEKLEERVREATRTIEEERNRLATVLRTMVDGVVVANEAAEIILMNPRARIILGRGYSSGIGAPLSRILPGDRLAFHLDRLRRRWDPARESAEEVIFPLRDGKLLKGSLSVVPGPGGERAGFLLVFRDLSAPSEEGRRFEEVLREVPQLLRGQAATSRSLAEALHRHPDMPPQKQQLFLTAMAEELERLGTQVTAMEEAAASARTPRWPAVPSDPRELLQETVVSRGIQIVADDQPLPPVLVEPFSWVASLRRVLDWIQQGKSPEAEIGANLRVEEETVVTTFSVRGPFGGRPAELESLEICPAGEAPLPLGEAVRKNRGELWTRSSGEILEVRLALLKAPAVSEVRSADGLIEGEPEFYNFDLFLPRPVIERGELLQARLADLDYVVVDTETTGLQISQGDKVISISGIRIRRGRIQNTDIFNTLINPGRTIPPDSTRIHHISDHMVADAPSMNDVYPQFREYVGDAILVAHNAAFDKKCLDMAAAEAGLPPLDNPVLDTLLLSYALHQEVKGHSLEAIAARLGITIEGRHTSLGDARAAAQVFLRLLSLLPTRGVSTLAEAKAFCDRHLLLRWQSSRY